MEAGLKAALLATGRSRMAYAAGGYHGTTLGALSCMARGDYRDPFEPVLAGFLELPFGDTTELEAALIERDVAAFLVEPIQVESGMRFPDEDYFPRVSTAVW